MNKKYLISSVSAMVLLLANPVSAEETAPDLSNKPITTPTLDYLGKTSAYKINQGTESDYSFINLVTDSEGNISKEYYKINLTGPKSVTWSADGNHEIVLNLPNSETPTIYKYSINPDAALGTRIDDNLTQDKVEGKLFANIQSSSNRGGAIYNNSTNESVNINSDFIGNSVYGSEPQGGAIYNYYGTIGDITGDFIGNYAKSETSYSDSGAIYNTGTIGDIKGDFIGNYAMSESSTAQGGAIHSYTGTIGDIKGDFIGNYAKGGYGEGNGGAIYNYNGTIGNITGDFIGNYAKGTYGNAFGGAIYNGNFSVSIGHITSDFISNHTYAEGWHSRGGAINNESGRVIEGITGNFIGNYSQSVDGEDMGKNYAHGGAIYNLGRINNIINPRFIGNYVDGNGKSNGGAIYNNGNITITAQNSGTAEFTGNYVLANGNNKPNAIYMGAAGAVLNLNVTTNGQIIFNDTIDGVKGYKLNIIGDGTGSVYFNTTIQNANITLNDGIVNLANARDIYFNNRLTLNGGQFNLTKLGKSEVLLINNLALNQNGILNIVEAETDLANHKMGSIAVGDYSHEAGGKINVERFLLTSDSRETETSVGFATGDLDADVETSATEAVAPIYKYVVRYNPQSGSFIFTRDGDDGENPNPDDNKPSVPSTPIVRPAGYKAFNPGVFANDVAAMSGLNVQGDIAKHVFDMDTNREYCYGRVWATPYYSDDTLSFSGFYDVDSKNYGLIAGVDSKAYGNVDGWNSVYTVFGAYNDGENKYQGVKVDTKSWLVGLKASVFNGGFYGDALVNYAWHDSDQTTAFGKDSVDTEGYGAALKAGYKHDFNKVNVDTSLMLSWQQVEGTDFTSKSGARFDTDDYSRLSLVPQIKVGYSLDNIRPYALARYNFVLSEDGSTTVNNSLALPEIESKDYVEYGLGVETTTSFPHSSYAHVLRHDGGREGWSVTAGYRYNF